MEWAKLVVDLIGHLSWPLAVTWMAFMFRGQIRGLLDPKDVESLEAGASGFKLTRRKIDADLSKARAAIESDPSSVGHAAAETAYEHIERMRQIAQIDPSVAVFASAAHFEFVLRTRLQELDVIDTGARPVPLHGLLRIAADSGLLTPRQAEGAARLNKMRNEIAHNYGRVEMDESQAIEFCQLAWELEDTVSGGTP